jgi:hypothetical protein
MKNKFTHRSESGQAMIMATIFFVIISTTVILGLGTMISSSQKLATVSINSAKAYYIAEAGVEEAAYSLIHGEPVQSPPSLDGHTPQVLVAAEGSNERVTSTAIFEGSIRKVEALFSVGTSTAVILSWKEIK